MHDREKGLIMASESVGTPAAVADTGLKRQVGPIGLAWASEGSIIGSGWLFGAFLAAQAAGTAALLAWVGTALVFTVLALIHSELGAMYPVAGGTARFPHYAFGSVAGASFGWFSWLQAVTVAPIEVLATISYASVHLTWLTHTVGAGANASQQLTTAGYAVAVGLMAVFTIINFLGVRWLAHTNSAFLGSRQVVIAPTVVSLPVTCARYGETSPTSGSAMRSSQPGERSRTIHQCGLSCSVASPAGSWSVSRAAPVTC